MIYCCFVFRSFGCNPHLDYMDFDYIHSGYNSDYNFGYSFDCSSDYNLNYYPDCNHFDYRKHLHTHLDRIQSGLVMLLHHNLYYCHPHISHHKTLQYFGNDLFGKRPYLSLMRILPTVELEYQAVMVFAAYLPAFSVKILPE